MTKSIRWTVHVSRMKESRSDFDILTGKPIGKRPLDLKESEDQYEEFD